MKNYREVVEAELNDEATDEEKETLHDDCQRWHSELVEMRRDIDILFIKKKAECIGKQDGPWAELCNRILIKQRVVKDLLRLKADNENAEREAMRQLRGVDSGPTIDEEILAELRSIRMLLEDRAK